MWIGVTSIFYYLEFSFNNQYGVHKTLFHIFAGLGRTRKREGRGGGMLTIDEK